MDLIIISGAGILALLVALFLDDILMPDLRRVTCVDGVPRSLGAELPSASPRSSDDLLTYDRAA